MPHMVDVRPGFKSDVCTLYADNPDWDDCCVMHDWYYWRAGLHDKSRREIDEELRRCVTAAGYPGHAKVMYFWVRGLGWILWWKNRALNELWKRRRGR